MAGSSPKQDIFDVQRIRLLVELMQQHDVSEIDVQEGEVRIRLRRGLPAAARYQAPLAALPAAPPPVTVEAKGALPPKTAAAEEEHIVLIRSPMVGTFYSAPDPDSPPYAKVGDHVGPETTVCIVEAMKVFNQIPAEVSGKIIAVLVENGEPVEFGQPLFKVDTRE